MSSKEFKKTVKTISRNFERYTTAMEADIQVLINSVLDLIESKICTLRKLLRLKICISNVKSISAPNKIITLEDNSISPSNNVKENSDIKLEDSLVDLSSMVYEIEKGSLPNDDSLQIEKEDDRIKTRLKCLEDIADIESLCSALNHPTNNLKTLSKNLREDNPRAALDKYIYLLLNAEKRKEKNRSEKHGHIDNKIIGDFKSESQGMEDPEENRLSITNKCQEDVVLLAKSEYEGILDVLNKVLSSYKMQETVIRSDIKKVEKSKTDTMISTGEHVEDDRKNCSDSKCKEKECVNLGPKIKNRKSYCL